MGARRSNLLVGSLQLLPVLLPRHLFSPPPNEQREGWPVSLEAPVAWPLELGLLGVETFVDTVRQHRPQMSTALNPGVQATMRLRGRAQRARAEQLGLTAATAPRASGVNFNLALLLPVYGLLALEARRRGVKSLEPLSWRWVFLGKVLGELDRRRSWRSAGGAAYE